MCYLLQGLCHYRIFTTTLTVLEPCHFTDDETKAQKGYTTFLRSEGYWAAE